MLTFLAHGVERVLYVDLDAHHGDGVQDAFADDMRVLTVSIHEEKRWPHSGLVHDRAAGGARNLPVPRGFNDSELDFLMEHAVQPLARAFEPQALVVTCGVDGLAGDPLSRLALSNDGLWRAVERLVADQPRAVVLAPGSRATERELMSGVKNFLPPYAVPSSITWLESMPRTPTGKIDRRALGSRFAQQSDEEDV